MTLAINSPIGLITAPKHIEEDIAKMTDAEIINKFDSEHHVDPFIFQEIFNRGLYSQTADAERRRQREAAKPGLFETFARLCEESEARENAKT
jgi:hypothetical protein